MIDESMDKEQMALPPQPWEFRSKPAYQRLLYACVTVNSFTCLLLYRDGIAYGDTYVASTDFKDGMLIERLQVCFKTGNKFMMELIAKFDNDINMTIIMAKSVSRKKRKPKRNRNAY
jgi:regulator of sigma E protease